MAAPPSAIKQLDLEDFIKDRVRTGCSHQTISSQLQQEYPGVVGLSTRSVTRFCSQNGIHYSSGLDSDQLDDLVEQSVSRVIDLYINYKL